MKENKPVLYWVHPSRDLFSPRVLLHPNSWLHMHRLSRNSIGRIDHVIIFRTNEPHEGSLFHRFFENDLIVLRIPVNLQWCKSSFRCQRHASRNVLNTWWRPRAMIALTFRIWLRQFIFWLIRQQKTICLRGWSSWFSSKIKSFPKVSTWISFRSLWLIQ